MVSLQQLLCLLLLALGDATSQAIKQDCPLWTSLKSGTCTCNHNIENIIQCEDGKGAQALLQCFCMTTSVANNSSPVVGPCLQTCSPTASQYVSLNTNTSSGIGNKTCGPFHRTGVLCSKCIEGYGLPVYSYNLSCVNCTDYKYNWIKYVAVHGIWSFNSVLHCICHIQDISHIRINDMLCHHMSNADNQRNRYMADKF